MRRWAGCWWSDKATVIPLALSPALFALFIWVEAQVAPYPCIPGRIVFARPRAPAFLGNFLILGFHMQV